MGGIVVYVTDLEQANICICLAVLRGPKGIDGLTNDTSRWWTSDARRCISPASMGAIRSMQGALAVSHVVRSGHIQRQIRAVRRRIRVHGLRYNWEETMILGPVDSSGTLSVERGTHLMEVLVGENVVKSLHSVRMG